MRRLSASHYDVDVQIGIFMNAMQQIYINTSFAEVSTLCICNKISKLPTADIYQQKYINYSNWYQLPAYGFISK